MLLFVAYFLLFIYCAALTLILLYSLGLLHLLVSFWKNRKQANYVLPQLALSSEEHLPFVTIQLPIYNELYVVERLLEVVVKINYPPEKLEIQVLDDSTDATFELLAKCVAKYQAQGIPIQHLHRTNRIGFKAGALAEAMPFVKGEFIAIFDADFVPRADFLQKMLPYFETEKVAMVQTRWEHLNQNYSIFTQIQAFHLDAHFAVEQFARCHSNYFMNFNGTAGIWRKSAIIDAGGWQHDTITEDLDLSYRARLKGWKLQYVDDIGAPAELPMPMTAIKSQQFRWMKGGAEVARKMLKKVWFSDVSFFAKWHATQHLLGSSLFIFSLLAGVSSVPLLFFCNLYPLEIQAYLNYGKSFQASFVCIFLFYFVAITTREKSFVKGFIRIIKYYLPFLTILMGLSFHNARAAYLGLIGKKSAFIRTPKFQVSQKTGDWKGKHYLQKKVPSTLYAEMFFCLYYATGLFLAFFTQNFLLFPFHLMNCVGFGIIAFFSWKHTRQ
ncbi:MAG: glycosyltransferase [Bacteroidia bacterium]